MTRLLQLALIDTLFVTALATSSALYSGHIHTAGIVAIAAVLAVFCVAAGYALYLARAGRGDSAGHISFMANVCPAIGIAGVASGFLVGLSGGTDDIQERVLGASSGLAATVVAVACWTILEWQAHLLRPRRTPLLVKAGPSCLFPQRGGKIVLTPKCKCGGDCKCGKG